MEVNNARLDGNADESPADAQKSEDHKKLLEYGIHESVADRLDEIYKSGKLAHSDLDTRALDALKEFPVDAALGVLSQFLDSNLLHVSNKSAYLCGVMKTYRQKTRITPQEPFVQPPKGPEFDKVKEILARTNYKFDVTTGQRKYGPPPDWTDPKPTAGCEVFCGKLPNTVFEDELIPLFEKCGKIYDLRLMMDPLSGTNRGYAFVTYTTKEEAERATVELDGYEIKPGKNIKVNISVPNLRLFIGNIPKSKGKEDIMEEFGKITSGLTEVIIYSSPDDRRKNRGFCFLEYDSHKAASVAKRRLSAPNYKVWGCDIIVDWADPQEEPDDETMSKVKVLYVRNLTQEVTENRLKETFEVHGSVERVKKIKDYAFIHFNDRGCALKALEELNGSNLDGATLEVSLAKPPSDKKKKEEILRARERRMFTNMQGRAFGLMPQPLSLMGAPRPGYRAVSNNLRMAGRGEFEYTMIPTAFIFLPTILCDYYYADFVYSNNNKLVYSMMPDSMCFVSKCIDSTERMMIGHGDLIRGCGLQAAGMLGLPALGEQRLLEIDNGMELHQTIGHGEMAVVAESAQLEIVAALQAMGSLQDKQGEKRSDKSLQKEGGQRNRTRNSYRRKGVGTNDWMGRERKRCTLDVSD